jgi:aquaporin Z
LHFHDFGVQLRKPDQYSASPVRQAVAEPLLRRALVGLAMGLTAVAIIYSPWGMRSGAHLNPALTTVYALLGKIAPWDALFYAVFQFSGGIAGVLLARVLLSDAVVGSAAVHYAATRPGAYGTGAAFAAEVAISFGLMALVRACSNRPRYNRYTGLFARLPDCVLHYFRSTAVQNEHESRAQLGFGSIGAGMGRAVGVFLRAPGRHADRCRRLLQDARRRLDSVLQAASRQRPALRFPLPLSPRRRCP